MRDVVIDAHPLSKTVVVAGINVFVFKY